MNDQELLAVKQRFGIIGNSSFLNLSIKKAMTVAKTDMSVLITGESGTGKESFSKIIHSLGKRKHKNFISLNCGALPEGTIDSELFGHEKGAFTGAIDSRKGYFETVNGGTIFLDEIGEMPLQTQSKLLRILEYGEYIKIGSSKVEKTDVRIVAATHNNLFDSVEKGNFREDLYYRLNTVPIDIPPLRKRDSDIHLLFRKFVNDFAEENRVKPIQLDEMAKNLLLSYHFPGNIRQLKNISQQMCIFEEKIITKNTLEKYLPKLNSSLPSIYNEKIKKDSMTDRDILYKILFDLKKEVGDLKTLINYIVDNEGNTHFKNLQPKHAKLLKTTLGKSFRTSSENEKEEYTVENEHNTPEVTHETIESDTTDATKSNEKENSSNPLIVLNSSESAKDKNYMCYEDTIEDIDTTAPFTNSLSIEKNEKQLIIRALERNSNKRKYAASDLGISERTLYRKIKQYDLE